MSSDLFEGHVPLLRPWLGEEEIAAVAEVIRSGWVSMGPVVAEFEEAIADYVGARHAVACSSATAAMHLGLKVMGLDAGDEVILPSFTCMANANAVMAAGGVCAFADIEERTFNLDPSDVESRITERTRAIVVVDQIGLPADLDRFRALAEKHDLILLDDAATSLGSRYKGITVGGHGVPTCFSFHPRKMITTGEGGMLVTDRADWAERAKLLRATGASVSDLVRHRAKGALFQEYHEVGYNYRLTDIAAAIGLVQMRRLDAMLAQRAAQAERYSSELHAFDHLDVPYVPHYAEHCWSSYCIRLLPEARIAADDVVRAMAAAGISCRRGIQPLHREPVFAELLGRFSLPNTEAAAAETLFLPIFPGMSEDEQACVIAALGRALGGATRS